MKRGYARKTYWIDLAKGTALVRFDVIIGQEQLTSDNEWSIREVVTPNGKLRSRNYPLAYLRVVAKRKGLDWSKAAAPPLIEGLLGRYVRLKEI